MADDRWTNRTDRNSNPDFSLRDPLGRNYPDRNWRDESYRYASDRERDRERDRDFGRNRERYGRDREGAYSQGGYDSGDYGYGRHLGGYSGGNDGREGLAAPGAFTDFGAPSSGGYASQYGSPSSPPATAWLGSSRDQGRGYDRGDYGRDPTYRGGEQRSFGAGNAYVNDVADGGEARGKHLGEHRGEHRGRGPSNYKRSDARIQEDVNDRLTDDAWLDAHDIDVKVKDREVTLTGAVRDRAAKRRAEILAEEVSGVDNVQNNLRVDKPEIGKSARAELGSTELGPGIGNVP